MSGLVGSVEPRVFTPPLRELTPETSWGFDIVDFARNKIREPLTPWQEWLAIHAFELLPPEKVQEMYPGQPHLWGNDVPRFKTVLLMVARQNGKTHFAKTVIKWALFRKRMKSILGAAQTKQDAYKLWEEILQDCRRTPPLNQRLGKVTEKNGLETLRNKHGGQYTIEGLDRGSGRGMTVNLLFMDEMREHKSWDGYSALSSTTLSPVGAMNLLASNAGDYRSLVLRSIREGAHRAITERNNDVSVGLFEWSADIDLDIHDRRGWAQANPDLGQGRLTERDIQAELEAKTENEFRTENLCQWVDDLGNDDFVPIVDYERWESLAVDRPVAVGDRVLAVEVSPDAEHITFVAAGQTSRGVHLQRRPGVEKFVVEDAVDVIRRFVAANDDPAAVVLDKDSPAGVLVPHLQSAGIDPVLLSGGLVAGALREMKQAVADASVTHDGAPEWMDALRVAKVRDTGGRYPSIERFSGDVSVLVAGTFAVWGLNKFVAEFQVSYKQVEVEKKNPAGTFPVFSKKKLMGGALSA